MTRESLIAISYPEPDKDVSVLSTPENVIKAVNGEKDDNYRSKLITMYNTKSPDTKVESVTWEL
ncbi:hypothetical protein MTR67_043709 [Solanum verrucosum]|uniref:Uncharacterized protein n=1 Tax=Solanum verrucosum TaxID=315347 RepID=A0AAF0US54_SOLVR|nr:hypothetical protein MTR67_043709 [Solanum verrucosum]